MWELSLEGDMPLQGYFILPRGFVSPAVILYLSLGFLLIPRAALGTSVGFKLSTLRYRFATGYVTDFSNIVH